jgi:G3E family GTPase
VIPPLPIVVVTGFLGSGKTTLLRRWRRDASLRDAAVIVHDLSEFGLDAELLADEGSAPEAGRLVDRVAALHGEHARGKLHDSVGRALGGIAALDPAPPLVLVESTGAARPWPLIAALTQDQRFFLRHFIVAVDALNLHRDFADGRVLTGEVPAPDDVALRHAAAVLAEQLAFASIMVLTKTDTIPKAVADSQARTLRRCQPRAAIGLSARAGLMLPQLDGVPPPKLATLKHRAEELGLMSIAESGFTAADVDCLVLREKRPFHPQRLHDACQRHLATGLYRTKGFLWLASRPGEVLLWQQSGSQITLELNGFWRAEMLLNHGGKLLPEEIEHLKTMLEKEHPVFGDRHVEITLIGLKPAREAFAAALDAAFCTDAEIEAWQRGETFPDPWPTDLRRVD